VLYYYQWDRLCRAQGKAVFRLLWHPRLVKKVKQSHNRPGVAQRVPGVLGSQISMASAREGGEVSLTHRPPLPPGNVPVSHFHLGLSRPQGLGTVGRNMSLKNPVTTLRNDHRTVRLVAQRLNHYATPVPSSPCYFTELGISNVHFVWIWNFWFLMKLAFNRCVPNIGKIGNCFISFDGCVLTASKLAFGLLVMKL